MAKKLERKHPLAARWLHWINFPLLFLMIWSGLLIYWANAVYKIEIFGYELFKFFPAWFYDYLGVPFRLAEGLQLHFFFMWFFIINGVLYVLYTIVSGEWRALVPVPGSFKRALQVTLYDLKISKYHPPQGKYNDAQRIAYTSAILMGVGSTLTGLAIYKPTQLAWLTFLFGGYEWARWLHFWLTVSFVMFFVVHVAQVARAGWNNFQSIITGHEVVTADEVKIEKELPQTMTAAEKERKFEMSENEKIKNQSTGAEPEKDTEILVERVREIEAQKKSELEAGKAKNLERENTAKTLSEKQHFSPVMTDDEAKKTMRNRSRRSFLIAGASAVAAYFGYGYLREQGEAPFRRAFEFNESVSQTFYSPARLAPEFARERVGNLRVNGGEGLSEGFDPQTWKLQVVGIANQEKYSQYTNNIAYETAMDNQSEMRGTSELHAANDPKQKPQPGEMPPETMDRAAAPQMPMPGLLLTLDDIKQLPRVEMTTELKCIEGWSTIVNWAGVRLSDFMARYLPTTIDGTEPDLNQPGKLAPYISMVTPDGGYYVGLDMPSALHPQTFLAYEMNGAPLTLPHGAPLRLVTPTKYGIKQIKRIGRIAFTTERPADFWAERGYDWYAGL